MAIANHVVECFVAAVVSAIMAALGDEYKLLRAAPDEVAFLAAEQASMRAFVQRASAPEASAEEVRQLSGDIERSVDAYNTAVRAGAAELADSGRGAGFWAFVGRCARLASAVWSRRRAAEEVRGVKARVVEAGERRKRYRVDDDRAAGDCRRRRCALCRCCGDNDTATQSRPENTMIHEGSLRLLLFQLGSEPIKPGDVHTPEGSPPAAATEEETSTAARLEKLEREMQLEREERRWEREYWARALQLLQSTAEKLDVPQPPPPPPPQADAVATGDLFLPGTSASTAVASGVDAPLCVHDLVHGGGAGAEDITDPPGQAPSVDPFVKD